MTASGSAWVELRTAVRDHVVGSWWAVDRDEPRRAAECYALDGQVTFGQTVFRGRAAIEEVYEGRRSRGPRTSRHLVVNDRVSSSGEVARMEYVMVLYAADGEPVLPSSPPTGVFDVVDELVGGDGGGWLLRSRQLTSVFRLESAPLAVPFHDP